MKCFQVYTADGEIMFECEKSANGALFAWQYNRQLQKTPVGKLCGSCLFVDARV